MASRFDLGRIELWSLSDGVLDVEATTFFPDTDDDFWEARRVFIPKPGRHVANIGSYLVRSPEATILIDTGIGPTAPPAVSRGRTLIDEIAETGTSVDEIDLVVLTHFHIDHIGWNRSRRGGAPLFSNARYLCSEDDWRFLESPEVERRFPYVREALLDLAPYRVVDLVGGNHELGTGIRTIASPGHTPGHLSIEIECDGVTVVVTGDVLQSPVQVHDTGLNSQYDLDHEMAAETRKALVARIAGQGSLMAAGHFLDPSVGILTTRGDRRVWKAVKPASTEDR